MKMSDKRPCSIQFPINHYSNDDREFLIKKEVREEVAKFADVDIAIRGRYIPPKEINSVDSSRLLHFLITGRTKQNLNTAIQKFESLLEKNGRIEDDTSLEEKITVGIDVFPSIFRLPTKILGEHNENVDYLTKETGAIITLRGKGSGCPESKDDELHVLVKYKDIASKPRTRELILNLIETVQQDFFDNYGKFYSRPKKPEVLPIKKPVEIKVKKPAPPPKEPVKNKPKNVDDDTGSHIEKITLGLKHVPIKFNLKSKIYGPNLSNVKHIEKVSSAVLLVEGVNISPNESKTSPSESPHILVKYLKPELKDTARSLILNLIETIHQDFESVYGAYLEKPESPEILPVKAASNFSKLSSSEKTIQKPPEKSSPPPVNKYLKEDLRPESHKIPHTQPAVKGVVPPPPPVISKSISPDFLSISDEHSINNVESEPLGSFSGLIEPIRTTYHDIEPVRSSYPEVITPARPSYAEVKHIRTSYSDQPNTSYELQNIKPIPSIVPPVAGLSSQPILSTATYPQASAYDELSEIPQLSDLQPSNVEPLLSNNIQQYYKKRSNSPVEMGHETKKFCAHQPNTTPLPYVGNIESIDNYNISREGLTKPAKSSTNNRYLVELPKVNSTQMPKKGAAAAKRMSSEQPRTPKRSMPWDTSQSDIRLAASPWHQSPQNDQTPAVRPCDPKSVRWSEPERTVIDDALLPPTIPATWNPSASSAGSAPWDTAISSAETKKPTMGQTRKPVSLKLRGPVKHQLNGKPVADDEAVMSFLNECAKSATSRSKYNIFDDTMDDDTKSVILIDSDDECVVEAVMPSGQKRRTRTVAIQTDEGMRQINVRCACGRFTRAVNSMRSVGVQANSFRYGQKY